MVSTFIAPDEGAVRVDTTQLGAPLAARLLKLAYSFRIRVHTLRSWMINFTLSMLTLALLWPGTGIGSVWAADPMSDKEAKPTLGERITEGTIRGTLMRVEGEYFWVKDNVGRDLRLHVDQSTKLDKVAVGDKIKAYVTDELHITTLQRESD